MRTLSGPRLLGHLQSYRGISLLECLVVLCLVGILMTLATPGVQTLLDTTRTDTERRTLMALVQASRHAAANLNQPVVLCPEHADELDRCGKRNQWHGGAIAFTDANRNRQLDGNDVRVARIDQFQSRITFRAFRNRSYLGFMPTGLTDWQNGHFVLCPTDGDIRYARQLVLNYAGRAYFSKDEDGDGVDEDVRGKPLSC
ncbi:MAG: GspH/FimT family protein [Pseudomonadota bacterium]